MTEGQKFNATESVYDRLNALIIAENNGDIIGLRIFVKSGGCSGFQYGFELIEETREGDYVIDNDEYDIKIVIDPASMEYLNGATIDYIRNLEGEYFSILDLAAQSTCGCGKSFCA